MSPRPKLHFLRRAAAGAALAAMILVAGPATAGATVAPPVVTDSTLTVTSDDGNDTVTLAAAGGVLTVNGAPTTLASNANAQIVVEGGGGDDVIDATALAVGSYGTLTADAGPGRDAVTGGAGDDTLLGGPGNDRLVGFRGLDDVSGGEGDDVMVWNNGDNTDSNSGDGGTDEVEVNGSPLAGDVFTVRPAAAPAGWVRLDRQNLIRFGIDLSAERLTINGLGGDDQVGPDPEAPTGLAPLTSLRLNGAAGADSLDGGDGADLINGGADVDALFGNEGADQINGGDDDDFLFGNGADDRLAGDRGADAHVGGEGDDALVWNNGDGSDVSIGQGGFDRLEVNGSATGGDAFELVPDGDDAIFRRTNLVPFTIELSDAEVLALPADVDPNGGVEAVTVNGGGGDDGFTVAPGLPGMLVAADGGAGDDQLAGDEEADRFLGGSGDDVLTPGAAGDLADGGDGDDQLFTRDKASDLVHGGAGADRAETDSVDVDAIDGVEELDATPLPSGPDTRADLPVLGKIAVLRRGGNLFAQAPISCPAAEAGGCAATVTLETAKAVRLGKVRAPLVLGSKRVRLAPGASSTVSVRLADGASELAKRRRLQARLRVASTDAAGNSASGTKTVELRIPGQKQHGKGHKHHGHTNHPPAPAAPPYAQGPAFGQVTVAPDGPGRRLVTVETIGPAMSTVEICDLSTPECVDATLEDGRWVASVPAPDPDRYSVGMIGRSGSFWVTDNASSNPPAPIPPPVNIG